MNHYRSHLAILLAALVLSACSPPHPVNLFSPADRVQGKKKDPLTVAFCPRGAKPAGHYTVLGQATVSKFNAAGIRRQQATINDRLRLLAASMGGDTLVNINTHGNTVVATVILHTDV